MPDRQADPTLLLSANRQALLNLRQALRAEILAGIYPAGARLPSEADLMASFGASRHMVREAIAGLREEGLVVSRQGAGVFVAFPPAKTETPSTEPQDTTETLELFEFRIAAETEAAALAAIRRSPAQEEDIFLRHVQFGERARSGLPTAEADLALHLAIALAANNRQFSDFILSSGPAIIPRAGGQAGEGSGENALMAHEEHQQIVQAISRADAPAARQAMRRHLEGGLLRYRRAQQGRG